MSVFNDTLEALATTRLSAALARMTSMPYTMDLKRVMLKVLARRSKRGWHLHEPRRHCVLRPRHKH